MYTLELYNGSTKFRDVGVILCIYCHTFPDTPQFLFRPLTEDACKESQNALPSSSVNRSKLVPAKDITDRNPKLICESEMCTLALENRFMEKMSRCNALSLMIENSLLFWGMNYNF